MSLNGKLLYTLKGHNKRVKKIAFHPDGKSMASTSEHTIKVWNEGKLLRTLRGHTSSVDFLMYTSDGRFLISASRDTTVRVWNHRTGYHYVLMSRNDDWIMFDNDRYFDSSRNGGSLVNMVQGITAYGIDQFAIRNNRPDLMLIKAGFEDNELIEYYKSLYRKRIRRSGFSEEKLQDDLHVPTADIKEVKQEGKFTTLNIDFHDTKYDLKNYHIYINDVSLFGSNGKEITGKKARVKHRLELTKGNNKNEVSVINAIGNESFRVLKTLGSHKAIDNAVFVTSSRPDISDNR